MSNAAIAAGTRTFVARPPATIGTIHTDSGPTGRAPSSTASRIDEPSAIRADIWLESTVDPDQTPSAQIWIWMDEDQSLNVELYATAGPLRQQLATAEDFQLLVLADGWRAVGGTPILERSDAGDIHLSFPEPLSPHTALPFGDLEAIALTFIGADGPARWAMVAGEGGEFFIGALADFWLAAMLGADGFIDGSPAWMTIGADGAAIEGVALWTLEEGENGIAVVRIHALFPEWWQFGFRFFHYTEMQYFLDEQTRLKTQGALAVVVSELRAYRDSRGGITGGETQPWLGSDWEPLDIAVSDDPRAAALGAANAMATGLQMNAAGQLAFEFDGPDGPVTLTLLLDVHANTVLGQGVAQWLYY